MPAASRDSRRDADTVRELLAAMAAHDWDTARAKVAANVVRVGPYRDTYRGRDQYIGFLAELMPSLPGYAMHIDRVIDAGDGVIVVELREIVEVDGSPLETSEALVFDVDGLGDIARIAVYIQNTPVPEKSEEEAKREN